MNLLLSTGAIVGIILGVVAFLILLGVIIIISWYISTHNALVAMQTKYEEAWSNIDIYLKKRYDLIPNLVETVKGYAAHESSTFTAVAEARSKANLAQTTAEKIEADANLTQATRNFNMALEKYPELKANTNFMDLQNQLKNIESELERARRYYNGVTRSFNAKIRSFPASIVANKMGLEKQEYYEITNAAERENVKVSF